MIELMIVTAIALFFSTFSSPFLSAVFTIGLWVVGQFGQDLREFGAVVNSSTAATMARGLSYVLPDFAAFDVKAQVVHGQAVPISYVALTSLYGVAYLALLLAGAVVVFSRRDFK
jgi:ABC-type transport system involved in multi-copper enzyme maturation permease subunit